ncbi:hypothetical protein D3C86_1954750 [compost metagenome]
MTFSSAFRRSTTARGVPRGATRPPQVSASKPAKPCSATDLMPGSSSLALLELPAMARSLPAWMWGRAATTSANITGIWPPIRSVTAGALPR